MIKCKQKTFNQHKSVIRCDFLNISTLQEEDTFFYLNAILPNPSAEVMAFFFLIRMIRVEANIAIPTVKFTNILIGYRRLIFTINTPYLKGQQYYTRFLHQKRAISLWSNLNFSIFREQRWNFFIRRRTFCLPFENTTLLLQHS